MRGHGNFFPSKKFILHLTCALQFAPPASSLMACTNHADAKKSPSVILINSWEYCWEVNKPAVSPQGTGSSCGELLHLCWLVTWNLYPTESYCVAIVSLPWNYWLYLNVHFVLSTARVVIRLLFMLPLGKVIYVGPIPTSVPVWKAECFIFNYLLKIFIQNKLLTEVKYLFIRASSFLYLLDYTCYFGAITFNLRKHPTWVGIIAV